MPSSIPTNMKAAIITSYGPILETVQVASVPVPKPKDDEVLIRVHFAALNPLDNLLVLGYGQGAFEKVFPIKLPHIIGYDVSGVVVSVGPKATKLKVGDEVYSWTKHGHGTLAEYVAESEKYVSLKPSSLSFAEAAAVPLAGLTALQAFQQKLQLKKGDKILITSAAGGVGTFATQIAANVIGAFVSGTASEPKHAILAPLLTKGQFNLIDYKTQDFTKTLSEYDAVLDSSGEVLKSVPIVRRGGAIVSIANQPFEPSAFEGLGLPQEALDKFAAANAPIFALAKERGVKYQSFLAYPSAEDLDQLTTFIQDKKVTVVLDKTFPLDQAAQALAYLSGGRVTGKVVIKVI